MAKYRKIGEIVRDTIEDKMSLKIAITKCDYNRLKEEAFRHDTSAAEIIRVIIREHLESLKES